MQIIADITGRTITTTNQPTMAGAIGAAMCAFVGAGIFSDFTEVDKLVKPVDSFIPNSGHKEIYDELFINYKNIYSSLKTTYQKTNSKRF